MSYSSELRDGAGKGAVEGVVVEMQAQTAGDWGLLESAGEWKLKLRIANCG